MVAKDQVACVIVGEEAEPDRAPGAGAQDEAARVETIGHLVAADAEASPLADIIRQQPAHNVVRAVALARGKELFIELEHTRAAKGRFIAHIVSRHDNVERLRFARAFAVHAVQNPQNALRCHMRMEL